jgi:hypothetical protein
MAGLRERVKAGELSTKDALRWVKAQDYQSPELLRWLRNRVVWGK